MTIDVHIFIRCEHRGCQKVFGSLSVSAKQAYAEAAAKKWTRHENCDYCPGHTLGISREKERRSKQGLAWLFYQSGPLDKMTEWLVSEAMGVKVTTLRSWAKTVERQMQGGIELTKPPLGAPDWPARYPKHQVRVIPKERGDGTWDYWADGRGHPWTGKAPPR